jgi:hypothetical protein
MARWNQRENPAELALGRERFAAWRRTRRPKARIPEALWELAVRLAAIHGVHRTTRALNLDYYSLKKRVEAAAHRENSASAFIELPPVPVPVQECVIECEDGAVRLRVQLKGYNAAEIATVGRSFRDAR